MRCSVLPGRRSAAPRNAVRRRTAPHDVTRRLRCLPGSLGQEPRRPYLAPVCTPTTAGPGDQ
eukprot:11227556-Lingulodinium_polyedra.AAC.1